MLFNGVADGGRTFLNPNTKSKVLNYERVNQYMNLLTYKH